RAAPPVPRGASRGAAGHRLLRPLALTARPRRHHLRGSARLQEPRLRPGRKGIGPAGLHPGRDARPFGASASGSARERRRSLRVPPSLDSPVTETTSCDVAIVGGSLAGAAAAATLASR